MDLLKAKPGTVIQFTPTGKLYLIQGWKKPDRKTCVLTLLDDIKKKDDLMELDEIPIDDKYKEIPQEGIETDFFLKVNV